MSTKERIRHWITRWDNAKDITELYAAGGSKREIRYETAA